MSYFCQISFKKIEAEDIQDFFVDMKKKARERSKYAVEANYVYSPAHHGFAFKDLDENTDNLYLNKYQIEQKDWVRRLYTYRWFYLREHHLLGVFGVGAELFDCFEATLSFQNSCDQDYEFEYWDKVKIFKDMAQKHKTDTWKDVDPHNDYTEKERTDEMLEYLRKSACYDEIWTTYLEDKLYDRDACVFMSLFSPNYDDIQFIGQFAVDCYKKTVEELKKFYKELYGDEKVNE